MVFRLLKKEVATEAFAYMSDEARDDLVNAFSDVELVSAIEEMSLDDAAVLAYLFQHVVEEAQSGRDVTMPVTKIGRAHV